MSKATRSIGRYLLLDPIASGGMATVHLGRMMGPAGFSKTVAIKALHPHLAADPQFTTMFLDEARLAARILHPNVVQTLDVVAVEDTVILVLEYVHGVSLADLARRVRGPLPHRLAASVLSGVLHGLHAAHEAKGERGEPLMIVHRDVSPQNILVGSDGVARVIDFGVAKAFGRLQVTREGQIKGKLSYMGPEQIRGRPLTRKADVFSASIVLWEALTGQRLFGADNDGEVVYKVLEQPIEPPSSIAAEVPPELDAVVLRGLERDPEKRFATARELAIELERVVGALSALEIGEWVDSLAHETLARRSARVADLDSGTYDGIAPAAPQGEPTEELGAAVARRATRTTAMSPDDTAARAPVSVRPRAANTQRRVIAGAGALLAVVGGAWLFAQGARGARAPENGAERTAPASAEASAEASAMPAEAVTSPPSATSTEALPESSSPPEQPPTVGRDPRRFPPRPPGSSAAREKKAAAPRASAGLPTPVYSRQ